MIKKIIIITILLFLLELLYLKIARAKNIVDKPNHRSAHSVTTIRGGGIIIIFAFLIYTTLYNPNQEFYYLLSGVLLVSAISFIDDLIMLSSKLRIFIHLLALCITCYSLGLFDVSTFCSILFLVLVLILSIGFLNIYNFMDGINGITVLNALVSFGTLLYLNENYIFFTNTNLLITLLISVLIFGFFNFRKKALCFAGDIGSISIGFILIYFVLTLYLKSKNSLIFLILAVYLLDGGWTIFERILKKENIFEAHKRHLYQKLVNDLKLSHLKISTFYFLIQLAINILLVILLKNNINGNLGFGFIFISLSILYYILKKNTLNKIGKTSQ